jgi:hypothetical protein
MQHKTEYDSCRRSETRSCRGPNLISSKGQDGIPQSQHDNSPSYIGSLSDTYLPTKSRSRGNKGDRGGRKQRRNATRAINLDPVILSVRFRTWLRSLVFRCLVLGAIYAGAHGCGLSNSRHSGCICSRHSSGCVALASGSVRSAALSSLPLSHLR